MRTLTEKQRMMLKLSIPNDVLFALDRKSMTPLTVHEIVEKVLEEATPETIDETKEDAIGATLARVFKLRHDPRHKERWQTAVGSKTNVGVYRTTAGILKDHKHYGEE